MTTLLRRRLRRLLWAATALATTALAATLSLAPANAAASAHPPVASGTVRQRPALPTPAHLGFPRAATPATGAAAIPIFDVCDQGNVYCMRDPSDGGDGTEVVTSARSVSESEDWVFFTDPHRCGGIVTSTCPGGIISSNYQGKTIYVISNYGAAGGSINDCIKANAGTGWKGVIGACDGGPNGTTNEISSAFVYQYPCSSSSYFCLVSIKYGLDNNAIAWLTSYHNANLDLYLGNDGAYSNWAGYSD